MRGAASSAHFFFALGFSRLNDGFSLEDTVRRQQKKLEATAARPVPAPRGVPRASSEARESVLPMVMPPVGRARAPARGMGVTQLLHWLCARFPAGFAGFPVVAGPSSLTSRACVIRTHYETTESV